MSDLFRTPPPGMTKKGEYIRPATELTIEQQARRYEELQTEIRLREGLPFKFGWKWYPWAREFFESTNKTNLLCAANQISKSSTQIRKCITWATEKALWPSLWLNAPVQFWYLYPTKAQVNAEFETKWKQFLPKGEFENDPVYGWKVEKYRGDVIAIHFNSGVHVYFKTYAQETAALQTGTCDAIFCDEELPLEHYEELMFRLAASNGYFHMVFTATLGQDFWRRTMEPEANEKEELIGALKLTVSLYDAMKYEDGTPSQWTLERIKTIEAKCSTHNEVLKRVFGKFIVVGGRKYEAFDIKRHMKTKHPVPKDWLIYGGADPGSGGKEGHPSALCYVAVKPDFRQGRVFLGWRGDGIPTTAGDVVEKGIELKKENRITVTAQFYDWGNKDFDTIATRVGDPYQKADKSHDKGEEVINTLFKNDMMFIYEDEELVKLAGELSTLKKNTSKEHAKDDFADAFRYAVTKIPWDWTAITGAAPESEEKLEEPLNDMQRQVKERRKEFDEYERQEQERVDNEFAEWNEAYGADF